MTKSPTNSDLLVEIRSIKDILKDHDQSIEELKNWKIAVEAAKQALKEYQANEAKNEPAVQSASNKAFMAVVGVIGLLSAVILALLKAS